MHVLLQPCGDAKAFEHFERTILQPVPVSAITGVLDGDAGAFIERMLSARRAVSVWGVLAGVEDRNVRIWDQITTGDLALFARQNHIVASAYVIGRGRSEVVARKLWGTNDDGNTWEYLYFLDGLTEHRVPYEDFNHVVKYAPNAIVRDFRMLDDEKSDAVVEYLDITDYRYQPSSFYEDHRNRILARLAALEDLDISQRMKARLQKRVLRNLVFADKRSARCCMCGREYPVEFMVAGRLKSAAACTPAELRDFANIAAPMCQNGCFAMYERGYIVINGSGMLQRGRPIAGAGALGAAIDVRVGRLCSAWSPKTAPYFAWHFRAKGGAAI